PDNFPLTQRDSFGFNQTNISDADNHIRISPGLEPERYFKNYRDYIVLLNDVLSDAMKKFPDKKEAIAMNILLHGDSLMDLVEKCSRDETLPESSSMQRQLEQAWNSVIAPTVKIPRSLLS
ncbi:MAG: hypothetical protein HC848_07270, partial [Limnobacter sp.]|nr:hypothetical protein [Limnobacter sp.]